MKLSLISDLHLDCDWIAGEKFLDNLNAEDADLCVLAGDAYNKFHPDKLSYLFARLVEKYPKILFVPGNHCYWGATPEEATKGFLTAAGGDGRITIVTKPAVIKIDSQRFLCGTMWYPRPSKSKIAHFIDFDQVMAPKSWIFGQFSAFKKLLEEEGDENTVVVTHHLPHPGSVALRFIKDSYNHFFMTDMTDTIMKIQPKLWCHGHSHDGCDYTIGNTRIVNNPRGYPREIGSKPSYKPMLIEV